jgi:hypothetical protein
MHRVHAAAAVVEPEICRSKRSMNVRKAGSVMRRSMAWFAHKQVEWSRPKALAMVGQEALVRRLARKTEI